MSVRGLARTWSQALHSDAWWKGNRQQAQVETRDVQTGDEEKHFSPHDQPIRGHRLPGEVVQSSSLEIFSIKLDKALMCLHRL